MTDGSDNRLGALDGLRGVAVLAVIACHIQAFFPKQPTKWIERLYYGFVAMGWSGVDLFFVLSGFLITRILLENKGSDRYFSSFYGRRILRIWPLYYGLCALAIIIIPAIHIDYFSRSSYFWTSDGDTFYYWVFLNNFYNILPIRQNTPFLLATWSLGIEEQFYLIWPLLIWRLGARAALRAILIVFVTTILLRNALYFGGYASAETVYYMTFTHLDGIAIGSILSIAWVKRNNFSVLLQLFRLQLYVSAPLLLLISAYCSLYPSGLSHISLHPIMIAAGYTLCALTFSGLLLNCIDRDNVVTNLFNLSVLRSCGRYSYAMYLFHFPILFFVVILIRRLGADSGRWFQILIGPTVAITGLFVTYLAAALSWHALERRVLALKRFLPF
jgi:peptidoglycan/LPS O-acetylase OafA/YrhL